MFVITAAACFPFTDIVIAEGIIDDGSGQPARFKTAHHAAAYAQVLPCLRNTAFNRWCPMKEDTQERVCHGALVAFN